MSAKDGRRRAGASGPSGNNLFDLILAAAPELAPTSDLVDLPRGASLFEPGDDVVHAYFPLEGAVVSLVLPMQNGGAVEATTIGREGAVGGIVSLGLKPAYARGVVQIAGRARRVAIPSLEAVKQRNPQVHNILVRYADCLTAQVLQSVGCATAHTLDARCARWLLMAQDRSGSLDIPLTQEALADMFGVARTYVSKIAKSLQGRGAISYRRGVVHIERRDLLQDASCECYAAVRRHFERVLPGAYPKAEP